MLGTIIVGVILVIIVALIVRSMVHDKKNGKSITCGGECGRRREKQRSLPLKGGNGWSEILIKTKTLLFLVSSSRVAG